MADLKESIEFISAKLDEHLSSQEGDQLRTQSRGETRKRQCRKRQKIKAIESGLDNIDQI